MALLDKEGNARRCSSVQLCNAESLKGAAQYIFKAGVRGQWRAFVDGRLRSNESVMWSRA
jgi:hypothetical protein